MYIANKTHYAIKYVSKISIFFSEKLIHKNLSSFFKIKTIHIKYILNKNF